MPPRSSFSTRSARLRRVELAPLGAVEIAELVGGDDADGAREFEDSGGNPLFALELAAAGAGSADTLDELLRDRLDRLEACDGFGFGDGAYTTTSTGGVIHWEADTSSTKEGKLHWRGTVKGDHVEGTALWTRLGQKLVEYWFKTK